MRKYNDPFLSDHYYHVFNRAVGSEKMFYEPANYLYFRNKMKDHLLPVADIFCYNFLPNHFHLFLRIKPLSLVEEKFQHSKIKEQQKKYRYKQVIICFGAVWKLVQRIHKSHQQKVQKEG